MALKLPRPVGTVRIDYAGAVLIAAATSCLVLLTSRGGTQYAWGHPVIIALAVAGVLLLVIFALVEVRVAEPVIPLGLFRNRTLSSSSAVSFFPDRRYGGPDVGVFRTPTRSGRTREDVRRGAYDYTGRTRTTGTSDHRGDLMGAAHASGEVPAQDGIVNEGPPDDGFPTDLLSERDRQILAFERQWWKYAGAKEQAIREMFDMSATRYYQLLNLLIDRPEALAHDPMLVKRLRRVRSQRQRQRAARRLGIQP